MICKTLVPTLAFCALFGLASTMAAHAQTGPVDRPFKGSASGEITFFEFPDLEILYQGQATHLGDFTQEEEIVLAPDGTFEGTIVFTAANGDELYADLDGAFTSETTAAGLYTFTGGTGRFEGATGTATFESASDAPGQSSTSFEGRIQY